MAAAHKFLNHARLLAQGNVIKCAFIALPCQPPADALVSCLGRGHPLRTSARRGAGLRICPILLRLRELETKGEGKK